MAKVEVIEVGPRDGLQNESAILPTADKVRLIERSIAAGLRRIEAVSFVHPKRVPQMADAEAVMERVPRPSGVKYAGLVLNPRGLDRALATSVDEVNVVVVATDEFSQRNQGCSVEEGLQNWAQIAEDARAAGLYRTVTIAAAFGCPFEGEVPTAHVLDLIRRVAESAPDEIAIADTIGVGVPAQVKALLDGAAEIAPGIPLRCHFHNTRNTGYANALTALDHGVSALDASTGGFGGCPFAPAATGNIATEDLVYALDRTGIKTGIEMAPLTETATWLADRLNSPLQALLGRAGPFPAPRKEETE
ncbi:hydroxymethylglutaryl-CoA lyase [Actinomadura decatromicini]|uniref:Hydroxymethylglutaryl-CoA lyase n=1 Tax=Actinomadura decatromicini TaxID=2604572 RepID=A0A5D3FF25_9ACTN|nr:hydroxymethylglutaryl-CoA lyase [Actinomadura decatromicini]TYK46851.1 hydroxymethylglutaryl-CoA lyase [Actinomadura decatromicini]